MAYLGRRGALAPVSTADIPDNSITSAKIVDGAVAVADLGPNSVDSSELVDGSIDTSHIADDQVTGAKIENNPTIAGNLTVSGDLVPSVPLSHRNMIINGGMGISQRGTSFTNEGSSNYYACDRFKMQWSGASGTFNIYQDSDSPVGFNNSVKITNDTIEALDGAGDYFVITQRVEAQDCQRLGYGSATAKPSTLSFWVRSTVTGTGCVYIQIEDDSYKQWSGSYTISASNTWEYKTLTIPANTASTINDDTGNGLDINWYLFAGSTFTGGSSLSSSWEADTANKRGYGQTNLMSGATGRIFQMTGVQLELGENATPFEHRSYAEELAKCQRYCWTTGDSGYGAQGITSALTSDSYHRSRFFSPQTCRHKTQALTATVTDWGATSGNSTFAFYTSLTITSGGAGLNSQDVSGRLDAGSGGHSVLWPLNETDGTSPLIFDCEL